MQIPINQKFHFQHPTQEKVVQSNLEGNLGIVDNQENLRGGIEETVLQDQDNQIVKKQENNKDLFEHQVNFDEMLHEHVGVESRKNAELLDIMEEARTQIDDHNDESNIDYSKIKLEDTRTNNEKNSIKGEHLTKPSTS